MKFGRFQRMLVWCALPAVLTVTFQGCVQKSEFSSSNTTASSNPQGNGDAYSGKPYTYYHNYDGANPCADRDVNGKSLPNTEIQYKAPQAGSPESVSAFMVREQCQDLAPKRLDEKLIKVATDGSETLTYNTQTFNRAPAAGDFDLVRAQCPAGMREINGAIRSNLISYSQDWFTPSWETEPGVTLSMFGSIFSLPSMLIQRTDSSQLEVWRRPQQGVTVSSNTRYVSTFLVRSGSLSSALWKMALGSGGVEAQFDLAAGTAAVDWATNVNNVTSTIRPFGNGYIISVYFTTPANVNAQAWIGVTPGLANATMGALNDSIYGTAAQLERVNGFCQ